MRWPRTNLEEKQELRAATSASAERRAEGMWHGVTKKGLDQSRDREADIHAFGNLHLHPLSRRAYEPPALVQTHMIFAGPVLQPTVLHQALAGVLEFSFGMP